MKKDFLLLIVILALALVYENSTNKNITKQKHKIENVKQHKVDVEPTIKEVKKEVQKVEIKTIKKTEEPKEKFSKTKAFIDRKRAEWE